MAKKAFITESDLAGLAKKIRQATGKRKVEVAHELGVAPPSIFNAEERPDMSLNKLRIRMIETYSKYTVVGPVYYLQKSKSRLEKVTGRRSIVCKREP